jgi:uncharacterized protein
MLLFAIALFFATPDTPPPPFFQAIRQRDVATVRAMLAADPSLASAKSPKAGTSAVIAALFSIPEGGEDFIDAQHNEVLHEILARNPPLDLFETAAVGDAKQLAAMLARDPAAIRSRKFGWTLLHLAAFTGNMPNLRLLLERGAEVNVRAESKFRNTPLQAAILTGQYDAAKLLLEHGADAMVRQAEGESPLHEAASQGRADILQLLLDHGAEVNARMDSGETALQFALKNKHPEAAKLLESRGGKP